MENNVTTKKTELGTPSEIVSQAEQIIQRAPTSSLDEKSLENRLASPIKSDLFTSTGKKLGMGSWGEVAEYKGPTSQSWAVKRFYPNEAAKTKMLERNLTPDQIMLNESISLSAAARHVAPRIIARDQNGEMFVAMPFYSGGTFANKHYTYFKDSKRILDDKKLGKDLLKIADALAYIHDQQESPGEWKKRAHADLKPDNILIDERGEPFVSDLGSSTAISMSERSIDPRSNVGARDYRAPECYADGSHPDTQSDIFSWGAIALEKITGEKVYDSINPQTASLEQLDSEISKKINLAPRKWRPILKKALNVKNSKRFYNGSELHNQLEKRLKRYEEGNSLTGIIKTGLKFGVPAAALALGIYGSTIHEPTKLDLPSISPRVEGLMYKPDGKDKSEAIVLDSERIENLPRAFSGMYINGTAKVAKLATDNRVVAYLASTHGQAALVSGGLSVEPYSENQFRIYLQNTLPEERSMRGAMSAGPVMPVVAKSLEVALNLSKTEEGKIDLEDTMAISRIGYEKVNLAKRAAKSQDWSIYREAKNSKGEYILPQNERRFVDIWLSQYHADI
jgi:serine/threonine protein kinase